MCPTVASWMPPKCSGSFGLADGTTRPFHDNSEPSAASASVVPRSSWLPAPRFTHGALAPQSVHKMIRALSAASACWAVLLP
jgi:hypothetical protein